MKERNLLKNEYPELAAQFDLQRNSDLELETISVGSNKKVWWKCKNEHTWEARVSHRTKSRSGCPYCAGQKPTQVNSLASKSPEVCKLWDLDKNKGLKPSEVLPHSHKKFWWRCNNDHSWFASPSTLMRGSRCPYCVNSKVNEQNSLATVFPEIATEWHPILNKQITPHDVVFGSAKVVWWSCPNKHEWKSPIRRRTIQKSGCPYCQNILVGNDNNLAEVFPEIASEWDYEKNLPLKPQEVVYGSNIDVWWKCSRGHSWRSPVSRRTHTGARCPKCRPNVSRLELRIFSELTNFFSSVKKQQKILGFEFDITISSARICIEVDGYPWHENKKTKDERKNELTNRLNITLIRVRDKRLPPLGGNNIFYSESQKKNDYDIVSQIVEVILQKGHLTKDQRQKLVTYLSDGNLVAEKLYNSLVAEISNIDPQISISKTHPEIAEEWNYERNGSLKPDMVTIGSGIRSWWKCKHGHEWDAFIYSRAVAGCPFCSNKKVSLENSLSILYPQVAKEWHPSKNGELTPDKIVYGSGKRVWWQCSVGHEWQNTVEKRTKLGRGCPVCCDRRRKKQLISRSNKP